MSFVFALLLLCVAWGVPLAAAGLHATWLLAPMVLLLTAAMLRGGRSLTDRLMLATGLLVGLVCAGGMLFSNWAWGFSPVVLAGGAFTALLAVALITGRRPYLPIPQWSDVLVVVPAGVLAWVFSYPYRTAAGFTGRLSIAMGGDDNARHMALFDLIGRHQGYLLIDPAAARGRIFSAMTYYPQGWHLTTALLDRFVFGPMSALTGPAAFDHYLLWMVVTYSLMLTAVIWASLYCAGDRLHLWQRVALVTTVSLVLCLYEYPRLLAAGYPSEMLGLALMAVLAAIVVRPVSSVREQIVLMAALIVGVGFAYDFFLPVAGVLGLAWLVLDRRVWRHWIVLSVAGLATLALAPVSLLLGIMVASQADILIQSVGAAPAGTAIVAIVAVVALGVVADRAWRAPRWRRYAVVGGITALFPATIAAANLFSGTVPGYYFGKSLHLLVTVALLGIGVLAQFLPDPRTAPNLAGRIGRHVRAALATAAAVVVVLGAGGVLGSGQGVFRIPESQTGQTWAGDWRDHAFDRPWLADAVMVAYDAGPPVPGTMTLVFTDDAKGRPHQSYYDTVFLSSLQRTTGLTESGIYGLSFVESLRTKQELYAAKFPVRAYVLGPRVLKAIRALLAKDPTLAAKVTIVALPGSLPPKTGSGAALSTNRVAA
jgi:hypothetical protein